MEKELGGIPVTCQPRQRLHLAPEVPLPTPATARPISFASSSSSFFFLQETPSVVMNASMTQILD